MERFFIVTEQSGLHKDWFSYVENAKTVREFVRAFTTENGIEAHEFYADNEFIFIVPTQKDQETFEKVLCSALGNGLRKFKASSKIGKAWVKSLKDANLKIRRRPMPILYFSCPGGKFRSRLFDQDGILYCSIDPAPEKSPEGLREIKASEFYQIIEKSEKQSA